MAQDRFSKLPPELVESIVEHVSTSYSHSREYSDRQRALRNISLVNKYIGEVAKVTLGKVVRINKGRGQGGFALPDNLNRIRKLFVGRGAEEGALRKILVGSPVRVVIGERSCLDIAHLHLSNLKHLCLQGSVFSSPLSCSLPSLEVLHLDGCIFNVNKVDELEAFNIESIPSLLHLTVSTVDVDWEEEETALITKLSPHLLTLCYSSNEQNVDFPARASLATPYHLLLLEEEYFGNYDYNRGPPHIRITMSNPQKGDVFTKNQLVVLRSRISSTVHRSDSPSATLSNSDRLQFLYLPSYLYRSPHISSLLTTCRRRQIQVIEVEEIDQYQEFCLPATFLVAARSRKEQLK